MKRNRLVLTLLASMAYILPSTADDGAASKTNLVQQENPLQVATGPSLSTSGSLIDPGNLSANEIAQRLANPNTPLATLTLRNQWIHWGGDLPGADGFDSGVLLFQPSFPFPVSDTAVVNFRPAINYFIDQPVLDAKTGRIRGESGLGDMGFDLAYGVTAKSGLLTRLGVAGTIPIGADRLSSDTWALGPEAFLGVKKDFGVFGLFPSHQWDVSGPETISRTTIQPIVVFLPGNAWAIGSTPLIDYDWEGDQWTIPLQVFVGKTIKVKDVPLRLGLEMNYFVDQPSGLGQEWMVAFNISPVLPNVFAKMLGLGN